MSKKINIGRVDFKIECAKNCIASAGEWLSEIMSLNKAELTEEERKALDEAEGLIHCAFHKINAVCLIVASRCER